MVQFRQHHCFLAEAIGHDFYQRARSRYGFVKPVVRPRRVCQDRKHHSHCDGRRVEESSCHVP